MGDVSTAFEKALATNANLIVLLVVSISAAFAVDRFLRQSFIDVIVGIFGELAKVAHGATLESINVMGGLIGLLIIIGYLIYSGIADIFPRVFGAPPQTENVAVVLMLSAIAALIYFSGSVALCGRRR